ncbi:MAB_1171c family putative transporter [Streptomyces sp. NPDC048172]|uniref:MAB_1171c family putative transporter n=1 Tax=Streptomyces sp. NPDC048172 TaxID=3365505 RepID=UPI00371BD1C3
MTTLSGYLVLALVAPTLTLKLLQLARDPHNDPLRAITLCLACVASSYFVSRSAGALTRVGLEHRTAVLLDHLLMMASGYFLLRFYLTSVNTPGARRRARYEGGLLLAAATALTVLVVGSNHVPAGPYAAAIMTPRTATFTEAATLYLLYTLVVSLWWTSEYARRSPRPYATGLWLVAGGLGALALSCVLLATAILRRALGGSAGWQPVVPLAQVAAVLAVIAGLAWPALALRTSVTHLWRSHRRDLRRLEPLWRLLIQAYPDLRLAASRTEEGDDRRYGVSLRFHRRVFECRDGLVRISPRLGPGLPAGSLKDVPPTVLARHLHHAVRSGAARDPDRVPAIALALPPGPAPEEDVRLLIELSDAVRDLVPEDRSC